MHSSTLPPSIAPLLLLCLRAKRLATATGTSRLHALALPDLHSRLIVDRGSAHPLFDLSRHRQEGLLDVGGILGGCFEERNA